MRKLTFPLAFVLATSAVACSFSMHAGTDPHHPPPPQPAATTTPAGQPVVGTGRGKLGKRATGPSGPTPTPTSTATNPAPIPTTPPAGGPPVVSGVTPFGGGTINPSGYKGTIYWVPAGTTKLPTLASMQPNGFLFTTLINVTPQAFTTGFPGVDPTHTTNFAIRYEAPLVVTTEADYDFRIVSDDGAVLSIDTTPIVDNDGARPAPAEKDGPVHLIAGTHLVTIDYLQTTGNVALQVFCKRANDTERVCPTHL